MARTILVGDVHGCRDELAMLLDRIGLDQGDRVVMVGDLVVRGPDPAGTIDLLLAVRAESVRGNHEDRLLAWRAGGEEGPLAGTQRATVRALRRRHWAYLEAMPLWIDLPGHGLRVVHAGVLPGVAIERQSPRTLMYMRCIDRFGVPDERRERPGRLLWGEVYEGPPHVVFGHNARSEPQLHPAATGLDTGAVYGGRLTAMVLRPGETPPPPAERRDLLVSVPANRRYFGR